MNNSAHLHIENCRNTALKLLKPSKRDLEYGLALHAESVVVELYGFSPRCWYGTDRLKAAHQAGLSDECIRMMREEMFLVENARDDEQWLVARSAWEASGVTCLFQNAGEESQSVKTLIKRLANFTYLTDARRDGIRRAVKPDDILEAKKDKVPCLYLTCNGVPLAEDWRTVEEELWYIHVFFQLGCRMMHLTYNRGNMLGDGCAEKSNSGLTELGRAAIKEMNHAGIIVDVAHSGWRTSLEAAEASEAPIVASHTACCSMYEHMRGKPDNVIKTIADKGGVVGICGVPGFLGLSGDINALLAHIDHVCGTFGVEYVAIGMDRAFADPRVNEVAQSMPTLKTPGAFVSIWPEQRSHKSTEWTMPEKLNSLAWTNWPLFTVGLVQRGYSDNDIRKIIGENIMRTASQVLKE